MSCDQGEPDINLNPEWLEDELAESSKIDSWAQGAISKTFYTKVLDNVQPQKDHQLAQKADLNLTHKNEDITEKNETIPKKDTIDNINNDQHSIQITNQQKKSRTLKKIVNKDHTKISTEQKKDSILESTNQSNNYSTIKSSLDNLSMENRLLKNETSSSSNNNNNIIIDQESNRHRKKPVKSTMKQIPETMLKCKRINGSGKLIFDDEGNLISVPKLYPANNSNNSNNKQDESLTTNSYSSSGIDNNILGNKIPIQWRFVSESYCSNNTTTTTNNNNINKNTIHNQFDIKLNSQQIRTARSSISNSTNKLKTRNHSLDFTVVDDDDHDAQLQLDRIRLQKIKNASINLPNTIDLIDLMPGVTITDGEHLKISQFTNEQFTSILNTNWNNLEEIPSVKTN
ncbi:unnamed protein product [Schistosoma turkestanicum]|nr:unnamed protein product [Schistosoma turkestanicum]